mmetsp:Transcript_8505/g.24395  ORF Transcript_8505/g.24395 Transcript_8505/m.24395 type:complete len:434 (-) Transcript_8505:766-2067(-)
MVKAECKKLKETLSNIMSTSTEGVSDSLRSLCQDGKLLLMEMKDSNRRQCQDIEGLREETATAKANLDSLNLVLQNLLYEKSYYEKEIRACQDFKSSYSEEDISLMSLVEYVSATGDTSAGENHGTMLKRLSHEMQRRKELHAQLQGVKRKRAEMQGEEVMHQGFLKGLVDQLKSIKKATDGIKDQLQVKRGAMSFLSRHAELLPMPMYVLYSQLASCIDAHGFAASVEIQGSIDEAEAAAAQLLATTRTEEHKGEGEADRDGDVEMAEHRARRKGKAKEAAAAATSAMKKDCYVRHPLTVVLSLLKSVTDRAELMAVSFNYLPVLNVVTAEAKDPSDNVYLANLFPGDTGAATPNEANNQLEGGTFKFDLTQPARPYRWVQHLAGMDFLPAVPGTASSNALQSGVQQYRTEARHSTVLMRLRARKESVAGLK